MRTLLTELLGGTERKGSFVVERPDPTTSRPAEREVAEVSEIADKLIDNFNTASRDVQKVRSTSNLELFMDAWNSLSGYIEGLESRITELSQAVGLITTLKPTMVMDIEHPLDMAKEVAEYVTARIAELEGKIDQLTAHGDIERQDDKWIPEVQE